MRKYVLGLILVVMLIPTVLTGLGLRHRFEKEVNFEPVVHLLMDNGSCTGFIVAQDVIVTAAHCVADKPSYRQVIFSDKKTVTFETVYFGTQVPGFDYAILKAPTGLRRGFKFSHNALHPMQPVALIGHSEGENKQWLSLGMYLRTDGWMVFGMLAYPGDSGSPIINQDQEVVAVLYGGFNPVPTTVGTPISVVAEEMARLGIRQ